MASVILVIVEIMTITFEKIDNNTVMDLSLWLAIFAFGFTLGYIQHYDYSTSSILTVDKIV